MRGHDDVQPLLVRAHFGSDVADGVVQGGLLAKPVGPRCGAQAEEYAERDSNDLHDHVAEIDVHGPQGEEAGIAVGHHWGER